MDEEIRRLLGELAPFIEPPTADSIFTALASPRVPPIVSNDPSFVGEGALAQFRPETGRMSFRGDEIGRDIDIQRLREGEAGRDPRQLSPSRAATRGRTPGVLVHELMHQESIAPQTLFTNRKVTSEQASDPQVAGLINLIMGRVEDVDDQNKLAGMVASSRRDPQAIRRDSEGNVLFDFIEQSEYLAHIVEGGFDLARAANKAPEETIQGILTRMDEDLPGIREAFNFFIRRFPGEGR